MLRRPPRSTRTDTLFPYTTLFRSVFICVESWLNDRAEPATRGTILACYMVALYSGQALGQLILRSGNSAPQIPFELASLLISLAIIPVCLTRATAPKIGRAACRERVCQYV